MGWCSVFVKEEEEEEEADHACYLCNFWWLALWGCLVVQDADNRLLKHLYGDDDLEQTGSTGAALTAREWQGGLHACPDKVMGGSCTLRTSCALAHGSLSATRAKCPGEWMPASTLLSLISRSHKKRLSIEPNWRGI